MPGMFRAQDGSGKGMTSVMPHVAARNCGFSRWGLLFRRVLPDLFIGICVRDAEVGSARASRPRPHRFGNAPMPPLGLLWVASQP